MEQQENLNLFGLSIDPQAKLHLGEAARWGKFLAIVGFIMCGLIVLMGLFAGTLINAAFSTYSDMPGSSAMVGTGFFAVVYIIMALIYFFPCLFLYRFANNAKAALLTNEQDKLNLSLQNLKAFLRFFGILTIIFLVLFVLSFLTTLLTAASF